MSVSLKVTTRQHVAVLSNLAITQFIQMLGKLRKKNPEVDSSDSIDMRFAKAMEYKAKRAESKIETHDIKPKEEAPVLTETTSHETG